MNLYIPLFFAARHMLSDAWVVFWGFWLADNHWRWRPVIEKAELYRLLGAKTPDFLPKRLDMPVE